jgi:hypothetical protein
MNSFKRGITTLIAGIAMSLAVVAGAVTPATAEVSVEPAADETFNPMSEGDFSAQACAWRMGVPTMAPGQPVIWAYGETRGCNGSSWHTFDLFIQRHRWHGWSKWSDTKSWSDDAYREVSKNCSGSGNHNYRTVLKAFKTGSYPATAESSSRRYTC